MFLLGLISGVVITVLLLGILISKKMFIVNESLLGFDATVEAVAENISKNKWSMPHQYDLQETMKKNGFEVLPVKIFSMCQPQHASQILSSNENRYVSALMPCRVSVYTKTDGKTYISRLNAGLFSKLMAQNIRGIMTRVFAENEEILRPIIKR